MRDLRVRIVALVVIAAVVPVAVVGYLALSTVKEGTREGYARSLETTVRAVRRRVEERTAADRRAVGRLCERDLVVDRALLDLEAGRFGPQSQQGLVADLPPVMEALGLDTLELVDGRPGAGAHVLAAAHFPGRTGARDPALAAVLERSTDRAFVRDLRIRRRGAALDARTVLTACAAERGEVRVWIIGGRFLDEQYVRDLGSEAGHVQVLLTGASGEVPAEVATGGGRQTVHTFTDDAGEAAAHLVAVIDDSALSAQLDALNSRFLMGAVGAGFFALLLGLLLGLWAASPLKELRDAAERVAGGDLESTLAVRSGGEVGRALEAFNRMTRELRHTQEKLLRAERIAAWRDIARRIAHEIKNPLSPIQISIETMRKTYRKKHPDFDEIFEESTLMILEEVERLKRIVTEFSRFARMPRPKPEELDIGDVVGHVVGLHQSGDVLVELDQADDLPRIRVDREQITQVLVNLVQNAADAAKAGHGGPGGRVRVLVDRAPGDGGVEVRVQDDGPGIPVEERARVFEPYYTTKAGGTGLGLAIVHRIIGDHGGSIEIGASPLGGAEVIVFLTEAGPPLEAAGSLTDTAMPLVQRRD